MLKLASPEMFYQIKENKMHGRDLELLTVFVGEPEGKRQY